MYGLMVGVIPVLGLTIICMAKEVSLGQMEKSLRVNI